METKRVRSSDIPVLHLKGPARERGRAHGETLRASIHSMIEKWQANIAADLGTDPDLFLRQLVEETDFFPAVRRWTPDLLEEVEGIAEGAAAPFHIIFARQLSDEEPWFRWEKKLGRGWGWREPSGQAERCTSLGVQPAAGRPAIAAQNMDSPAYYDGHQVLLHITYPDSDLEALIFTIGGKISLAGMNNAPLAMCCNTVLQLDYAKDGLPEDFIVRGFLGQRHWQDGLAFLRRVKHASGQNYIVAGQDQVLSLECSAGGIADFVPYPGADRTFHTNHPLANDDQGIHRQRLAAMTPAQVAAYHASLTTHARFEALQRRFGRPEAPVTVEAIEEALSTHEGPVCIDGAGDKITLGCLIMAMTPAPTLSLAPGPPCSTAFATHPLPPLRNLQ
ncbi:MAG: C45 family peptidase [Caldilineales bacterium]|nr:C45 family peptidase [Caldilineales bacterium]